MATLDGIRSSLLRHRAPAPDAATRRRIWWSSAAAIVGIRFVAGPRLFIGLLAWVRLSEFVLFFAAWGLLFFVLIRSLGGDREVRLEVTRQRWGSTGGPEVVESEVGVVAADDGRCSEIGVAALRAGGHAVDAAVAAALCLGVVHPVSSGIGGGAFIVVRSADSGEAEAFDSRETAPSAASKVLPPVFLFLLTLLLNPQFALCGFVLLSRR